MGIGRPCTRGSRSRDADLGLPGGNPRRALAAQFERLVILECVLRPVEAAIGRAARDVLGHQADGRVGAGTGLFGEPFGARDIGGDRCRTGCVLAVAQQGGEGRRNLRAHRLDKQQRAAPDQHAGHRNARQPA